MSFFDPFNIIYEFEKFTFDHFLALFIYILGIILIIVFRKKIKQIKVRDKIAIFIAIFLIVDDIFLRYSKYLVTGDIYTSLPLHLCAINAYFISILLIFKNQKLYKIFYFFALLGTTLMMIFANTAYGPYNYFYWEYFITHSAYVWIIIYLTVVEGFSVSKKDILNASIIIFIISLFIIWFNDKFNTYFWYLNGNIPYDKLNEMFPWPSYYLIYLLLIPLIFYGLYLLNTKLHKLYLKSIDN